MPCNRGWVNLKTAVTLSNLRMMYSVSRTVLLQLRCYSMLTNNFFSNKIHGNNFNKNHSETVMVWHKQLAKNVDNERGNIWCRFVWCEHIHWNTYVWNNSAGSVHFMWWLLYWNWQSFIVSVMRRNYKPSGAIQAGLYSLPFSWNVNL